MVLHVTTFHRPSASAIRAQIARREAEVKRLDWEIAERERERGLAAREVERLRAVLKGNAAE
jgi:hypothetical protein